MGRHGQHRGALCLPVGLGERGRLVGGGGLRRAEPSLPLAATQQAHDRSGLLLGASRLCIAAAPSPGCSPRALRSAARAAATRSPSSRRRAGTLTFLGPSPAAYLPLHRLLLPGLRRCLPLGRGRTTLLSHLRALLPPVVALAEEEHHAPARAQPVRARHLALARPASPSPGSSRTPARRPPRARPRTRAGIATTPPSRPSPTLPRPSRASTRSGPTSSRSTPSATAA